MRFGTIGCGSSRSSATLRRVVPWVERQDEHHAAHRHFLGPTAIGPGRTCPRIDGWAERIQVGGVPITLETLAAGVAASRDVPIAAGDDSDAVRGDRGVFHRARDAGFGGRDQDGLGGRFDA